MIMKTGRLITLGCCAAILVLGVQAAPRIPTRPSTESEDELQVDLRSDKISSGGFMTDMKEPRCGVVDENEPNTGSRTKRWAPFGIGSSIHFNDDKDWDLEKLYKVAVHEIGHSLGLDHSNTTESTMSPRYSRNAWGKLVADDIAGIQALYGVKANSSTEKRSSVFCRKLSIDTIFGTPNGNIYAFKGKHYWKVTKDGHADGSPQLISSKWKELPGDIDAAFTYNRKTFFFKGSTCWTYVGDRMVRYPTGIGERFPGIPNDIDAATVWTGDGDIYFFKGSKYWRYQLRRRTHVSSAYPRPMTDWRGLPNRVNAAVSFDGSTYFFKGPDVYEFDHETLSVDSEGAQKMSPDFFGCPSG